MTKKTLDYNKLKSFRNNYHITKPDKFIEIENIPKKVYKLELNNHVHISLNNSEDHYQSNNNISRPKTSSAEPTKRINSMRCPS